jgi:hypothetical protein
MCDEEILIVYGRIDNEPVVNIESQKILTDL